MGRLEQLIEEINGLKKESTRRAALQIYTILDNNRKLFLEEIDSDYFSPIENNFERLSNASAREYNSPEYKRDFERAAELLSFHLNRII